MTPNAADARLFPDAVVEAVAADHDVAAGDLAAALARHQRAVGDLPGVENVVYEWRKRYADPVLARTEDAYFLVVPEGVWAEFGDHLDASDATLAAMVEAHRRVVVEATEANADPSPETAYVALDRREDE